MKICCQKKKGNLAFTSTGLLNTVLSCAGDLEDKLIRLVKGGMFIIIILLVIIF